MIFLENSTYTQNGSYPSWSPHMVKYFRESTSCPKFSLHFCPIPRVQAGMKDSPLISVNAASPADGSTRSSPFREKTEKLNI